MTVVVGVAGGSGSGKTTVVERLLERVGPDRVAYLPHDRYYRELDHLSVEERAAVNFDHPEAFDDKAFVADIDRLRAGHAIHSPTYDYATHTRAAEGRLVEPRPVVIVEGILIFASAEIRRRIDVKVYVDAEADVRLLRRLRRDVAERGRDVSSVLDQYERTVRPMHREFVEPSKRWADLIVPRGGHNEVAIDLVAARVINLLEANAEHAGPTT